MEPHIFVEFEGKHEINGVKRKYWIETATEKYFDEIIENMIKGFIKDAPLSRYADLFDCAKSKAEMRVMYAKFLEQNMSLLCLTNDRDGKPVIAGMNITYIAKKDDPKLMPTGENITLIYNILEYLFNKNNPFEALKCDEYLGAMGLYALPDFRGDGIGLELLKARELLCKTKGIKYSVTSFTSIFSQKLAVRAGYQDLFNITYKELFQDKPELFIPKIAEHSTNCRNMYIEYK